MVEQAADRRPEILLGRARLRLLGNLETRAPKQRAIHERGQLPDRLWRYVRDALNASLFGWARYFSHGTHRAAFRGIDYYVYERMRDFLARRPR